MRTIHYSFRLIIVTFLVMLFYWGSAVLFRQPLQIYFIVTLLFATVGIERMWTLLDWMGPVVGTVDKNRQERDLRQFLEREIARSLRYGSTMTVLGLREKKRTSLHVVAQYLRGSDAIFRGPGGHLVAVLPETPQENARVVVERLTKHMPIQMAVLLDQKVINAAMQELTTNNKKSAAFSAKELAQAYLRSLQLGLSYASVGTDVEQNPLIYNLSAADVLNAQKILAKQTRPADARSLTSAR